jgi:excinuclease ABC subunit A
MQHRTRDAIVLHGARQNNLKNLTVSLPVNELVVVTGVSGSGKSSLVFDTLYAEGQRRYVETFSPYARQFLDRMDKPQVDRIDGCLPAIAIDQTNPVRTSRSTVGTATELNDHLKLLFARAARLFCRGCGNEVRRDTPETIFAELAQRAAAAGDPRLVIAFPVEVPKNFTESEILQLLERQGYTRIHAKQGRILEVIQDRIRTSGAERARVMEALEAALKVGRGRVNVHVAGESQETPPAAATPSNSGADVWRFSSDLHCADCDIHYADPTPSLFSFNSPIGACETCRGFGRVIGVDYGLVIPDESKTLLAGAIKPWQTESYRECQDDLEKMARKRGVPLDVPWRDLAEKHRRWVIEGEDDWVSWRKSWPGKWYGVKRFFAWLETKAYKMHIRVLLSRYRAYTPCESCGGARLKPDALLWRLGEKEDADSALGSYARFKPRGSGFGDAKLAALPGLTVHDLMLLPIERCRSFFGTLHLPAPLDQATDLLLTEIRTRLAYLAEVGLSYLTLDRQSRTLSGGEVQRINLTTALGTSLVNTLFVLDEPSIGLHSRDMGRVIDVMKKLRDAGNSLVVVEHDPQIMFAADRILDMGPGPGERGGEIVFFGTPDELKAARTLTAEYLSGRKRADEGPSLQRKPESRAAIRLLGAAEHNLKAIDVAFPLNRLVCVTGVSGSGKSTLVQDVLYAALRKGKGKPTEAPGAHRELAGADRVADVVLVDQSPIGKTTRSNPASYVGAFDGIRKLFAETPAARERGYTAGTFSFNAGNGRCPTCGGNGFEHVEMQFLSDVYLRCPDCDGKRFRPEVLEVKWSGRSIADVLEMTVSEALACFWSSRDVVAALGPLAEVGLEYLRLGQPVPTLSGGEAQRLKLAGHLAGAGSRLPVKEGGSLFLFDEPTTGLHFDDVAKLLRAFRRLIDAGHSLVVIEHNLDVIRAADWLIDLGPEGGDAGGEVVCVGTPQDVMAVDRSHTGRALKDYEAALSPPPDKGAGSLAIEEKIPGAYAPPRLSEEHQMLRDRGRRSILVHHAREHNLKNIDVEIPRNRFTVVTGVSGSGKSTLAFDIVFAEGQRRYLESLNAYARQFVQPASRPDVDAIFGIPPTVAIEQRTSRGGRKSTVATLTEVYHFLRLLYMKLGVQHCPDCDVPIEPQSPDAIAARVLRDYRGRRIGLLAPLVVNRKGYYTDLAKWARGKGYTHLRVDGEFLPTGKWPRLDRFKEHTIELPVADLAVEPARERELREALGRALESGKGVVHVLDGLDRLESARAKANGGRIEVALPEAVFSTKRACRSCGRNFPELDPRLFSFNSKHGWCPTCYGTGLRLAGFDEEQSGEEIWWNEWWEGNAEACPACEGRRLNPVALNVRFRDRSIADLVALAVKDVGAFFATLALAGREQEIARDIVSELQSRLGFLQEVGLSYLSLDRAAPTLSGGEAQRIRLASQLGSNLQGVCYILDEPTIGLHPRDNRVLLETLEKLEAKGNTLLVVEHDEETIRRAHHVIDLGPGAGRLGGRVIAEGTAEALTRIAESTTGRFLAEPLRHPLQPRRRVNGKTPSVEVRGASLHNLKRIDARIPLGRLTVITGVSGSGKSTLARDVLHANLVELVSERRARKANGEVYGCEAIDGADSVGRVLEVDQTPIGKTPRSCPATYVGFWDAVRRLFADTTEARIRGYTASRFSFNTPGGRCDACEGQGMKKIEMSFLPDVKVLCDVCGGSRFNAETLTVRWRGKSIGDVLAMNVDEAVEFFAAHRSIHHSLRLLQDVGLGYLTLGQQSPTLSGGEAQRLKLVTELSKVRADVTDAAGRPGRAGSQKHTLYVLDEPTVGLHMADVEKLVRVLHRLVDAGNTVVVIEHNLDVIAEADWIIDLGPEGGDAGGRIVAMAPPEEVAKRTDRSHTARVLAEFLAERGGAATAKAA